ncbi:hypothetical protein Pmani_037013 [Petrolisthes manimaculis]|uniref:Uncharacterized protein n=1 Tax=Petrolisthes manimaculis TaxID=1843537 RepID=A0AAE1NHQ0_9EUCA|nr:hypothetical protein Pmani_037013 [Petrolisthes manimaculis]
MIRRARASSCLCPRPPALLHPGACRDFLQLTCNACRCRGESPNNNTESSSNNNKTKSMRLKEEAEACSMCQKEKMNKRNRNKNKHQAVRSYSSPPQTSDNQNNDERKRNKENQNLPFNVLLKVPPESEEEEMLLSSSKIFEEPVVVETRKTSQQSGLCRSFSFPDEWNVFRSVSEQCVDHTKERNRDVEAKNVVANLTTREARLLKLSRAGSLVERRDKSDNGVECYCQSRRHTKSFKSSGKLEIVNIRKPDMKFRANSYSSSRYGDNRSASPLLQEKLPSKSNSVKPLRIDGNNHEEPHSPFFLQTSSKTSRSSRKFLFEPLDVRSGEDGLASPTNNRQRKFSVFGRALGSFLSKGSLPDLPRATANICDKFGSLKKTIKKRSV